jgi:hypothetical protein
MILQQTYQIITDEKLLKEFIEWLPDLKLGETYYVCLFARNKYAPNVANIKSDEKQMARFICKKEQIFEKIKQLEAPIGSYSTKYGICPQEALACYIMVNPRDKLKATPPSIHKLVDLVTNSEYNGYNPVQEVLSEVHKSIGTKYYVDFDFDCELTEDLLTKIFGYVNKSACKILKTRGGFHLLIKINEVETAFKKDWYRNILSLDGCDKCEDRSIPIPGTYQGGFTPYFMEV